MNMNMNIKYSTKKHLHVLIDEDIYWEIKKSCENTSFLVSQLLLEWIMSNNSDMKNKIINDEEVILQRKKIFDEIQETKKNLDNLNKKHLELTANIVRTDFEKKEEISKKLEAMKAIRDMGYNDE